MDRQNLLEIQILIVEDDSLVAHDLKEILEEEGYEASIALRPGKALEILELSVPDLVILDINLENQVSGIDLAEHIQSRYPGLPYIFLTANSDKNTIEKVKTTFPAGFVAKPFHKAQILSSVAIALSGSKPVFLQEKRSDFSTKQLKNAVFSPREKEIIKFAVQGWPNKKIAGALFVSVNTVKFHMKNIFEKLEIHYRAELWQKVKDHPNLQ